MYGNRQIFPSPTARPNDERKNCKWFPHELLLISFFSITLLPFWSCVLVPFIFQSNCKLGVSMSACLYWPRLVMGKYKFRSCIIIMSSEEERLEILQYMYYVCACNLYRTCLLSKISHKRLVVTYKVSLINHTKCIYLIQLYVYIGALRPQPGFSSDSVTTCTEAPA